MGLKTFPNKITDEELTKILKETSEEEKSTLKASTNLDIIDFITVFNITEGKHFVSTHFIYKLYYNWSKRKFDRGTFFQEFTKYIPKYFSYPNLGYLININALTLSKQLYNFIDKPKIVISPSIHRHAQNFIKKFDIKPGDCRVGLDALYRMYDRWTYAIKKPNPLTYREFSAILNFFIKTRTKSLHNKRTYYLDSSILNHLTEEDVRKIKGTRPYVKKTKKSK